MVSLSFVECSAGCEVNSIVFEGFRIRLICLVQLNVSGMCALAVWLYLCSCG